MGASRKTRFTIPKKYAEIFAQELRIIVEPSPGLWPVDAKLLRSGMLEKMVNDKEFNANFEIVIMQK